MSVSDQVDALQKRVADLNSSFDEARRETSEQVKARIDHLKADIDARQDAAKAKAGQARRPDTEPVEGAAGRCLGQDAGPAGPRQPPARPA